MDYETVSAPDFGAALTGMGLNLLVSDVGRSAAFLSGLFGMDVHRLSADFAIMTYAGQVFQLHRDGTFGDHPLLGLVPESAPRGAGIELRLYQTDPDAAAAEAKPLGGHILQAPTNKPHGLRECVILDADGYAWVPSRPLTATEREQT
jgi:predicted enzyme related to lactoylglutathione lyase